MDSLLLAGDSFGSRALRMEVEARQAAGIPGRYLPARELREGWALERTGAILSPGAAVADPVRLTAGVLRRARQGGATIWAPVEVATVEADGGEVVLQTRTGQVVVAGSAVFCTGYELLRGVPTRGHSLVSTWVLATGPGARYPEWLDRTLVWEASDPYLYLRTAPGGRLLVGGEDEPPAERHDIERVSARKFRRLDQKLRTLLPDIRFQAGHRWAGTFGDSVSGLPRIDAVPGLPRCYYAMGFGGNGITNSMIAAQIIGAAIAGRADPDADVFRL
jgi:glycine/D-amino acid oxidase-like deaminating enzyme